MLGPVEVGDAEGRRAELGGRQRRALLAQLILAPGRVVSVDALAAGLWGDDLPPTAVKSIQVHVSRLRPQLAAGVLVTRSPGYLLDVAPDATDVACFDQLAATARARLAQGDVAGGAEGLRAALGLWRGPALADVADHPFAAGAVARLEEARVRALEDRVAADLDLGRHADLVGELEELVRAEPLRERLWAQLMVALYRCDRQADALDAFTRARRHLVDELGLEPGPDLRSLERQVLDHTVPAAPAGAAPNGVAAAVVAEGEPPGRTTVPRRVADLRPPPVLVGREAPIASLATAVELAEDGQGGLVAIRGDEGMGKSSLIAAFARSAGQRAEVFAGRCREHVAVPYGPWSQVMRQLEASAALELLEGAVGLDDALDRHRVMLFDAVARALREAASATPIVVVLDDLHWSDEASVSLLLHAADELALDPVLFVTAWRDREIGAAHPVNRLTHHLTRTEGTVVDLGPLTVEDIAALLDHTDLESDAESTAAAATSIWEATGGVPLFAAQVVDNLASDHDAVPPVGQITLEIPETVRTLVARRLVDAGPAATEVAEACAVLGEPLRSDLLTTIAGHLDAPTVLTALDRLTDLGVLVEAAESHEFVHAAFRSAILANVRAGRRQVLHASALRALTDRGAAPAVLVHHADGAGTLSAPDELGALLVSAADDAMRRTAFSDAAANYERAVPLTEPEGRARVLSALSDALGRTGDIDAMKVHATAALEAAAIHGADDQTVAEAAARLCGFGNGYGVDRGALRWADAALAQVTRGVDQARIHAAVAYHHAMWGSPAAVAAEALDAARACCAEPPPDLEAAMGFAEALLLLGSPDLDRRFAVVGRMIELDPLDPSISHLGRGLRLRCLTEMGAGRLDDARRTADEILAVATKEGSWLYRADAHRWQIATVMASGDAAGAKQMIVDLEQMSSHHLAGRAFVGTQRILLALFTGEHTKAIAYLDAMLGALPTGDPVATDRRLVELVRLTALVEDGQLDEARATYRDLLPHLDLDRSSCRRSTVELALCAGLVAELGLADAVPDLIARLRPFAGQLVVMSWGECVLGSADGYLATLQALGGLPEAEASLERALAIEDAAGDQVGAARTRARWARVRAGQEGAVG